MNSVRSIVHNFNESLEKSLQLNEEADWVAFYKRLWPEALSIVRVDKYSNVQTRGIDRMIWLPSGKQLLIDEKCREIDYGDILLETVSVGTIVNGSYVPQKVGWALDEQKYCDFIAYAIPPRKKCYLLPYELLRQTLACNFDVWSKGADGVQYPKDAKNKGYITRNIAIKWSVLSSALQSQMLRKFGSEVSLPKADNSNASQLEFDW